MNKKTLLLWFIINVTLIVGCSSKPSFIPPSQPLQTLKPASQVTTPQIKKITLLLPLTGNLANSGKAVQNGFLAAYYQSLQHEKNTISINVVDTTSTNVKELYNRSISQGSDFIIGPLTKSDVQTITTFKRLAVPTLVLNTVDNYSSNIIPNLYQFGLSSRDEAIQITKKAWDQNLRKALIIAPNNTRGRNLAAALNDTWQYFGGTVKTIIPYNDISSANQNIRTTLNINSDKNLKPNAKFTTYEGNDIDVVFLIASPEQGREVQPLIRFYINPNIPVYATSDIYSGIMQASLDSDLEGITFCDMPWILQADKLREPLMSLPRNSYARSQERLYALGIDAYYLMLNLNQLIENSNVGLEGATGLLNIDKYHHVYRTLIFAQIRNGVATPIK